jgi:hypothetical protein
MKLGNSILALALVFTSLQGRAMEFPTDCGDWGMRDTFLDFDSCGGGGGDSGGFGGGDNSGFSGGAGSYEGPVGIDSGTGESAFSGHNWYSDPKSPPQGPPCLYKYFILTKPRTEIEREKYYALNRVYPNDEQDKNRRKAYKEYNAWIVVERKRVKSEEDAKAYKAEDDRRIADNIALSKRQAEDSSIANEKLEAEMAPLLLQFAQDQQRRWDNWQKELAEKKSARLAQQEIDIAAYAEINEQRHAAWVIRNEERTARELVQKEAADRTKVLARNQEAARVVSITAQQAKADSVTTKAVAALCFTGETQINVSFENSKPIASIKVGDYVETCDINSFICERLRVTSITRNVTTHILILDINREITRVTDSHPYYSVSRGKWVEASELVEGETLRTLSGQTAALNGVTDEYGQFYVYNFEVEKNHNYYANGILVHNCTVGVVAAETVGMASLSTLIAGALVTNYVVDKVKDFASKVRAKDTPNTVLNEATLVENEVYPAGPAEGVEQVPVKVNGPSESKQWKELEPYRGKYKTSGEGREKRYYNWDFTHKDIEVYDRYGKHLGSMDPTTGELIKPPVKGREMGNK